MVPATFKFEFKKERFEQTQTQGPSRTKTWAVGLPNRGVIGEGAAHACTRRLELIEKKKTESSNEHTCR